MSQITTVKQTNTYKSWSDSKVGNVVHVEYERVDLMLNGAKIQEHNYRRRQIFELQGQTSIVHNPNPEAEDWKKKDFHKYLIDAVIV